MLAAAWQQMEASSGRPHGAWTLLQTDLRKPALHNAFVPCPAHAGMVEPYRGFGLRWGSDAFCQYVRQLESMANGALAAASEAER